MDLMGVGSTVLDGEALPENQGYALGELQRSFLFARSETIYGGSNEIQRNIIGERVLGLPAEPKGVR
jgi:alkylation response protein AidB-like acyl-CoA dehydrogenase